MTTPPRPRVARRPAFPLVWIVPLVALALGGWMVFRQWHTRGPEIVVDFADGTGIEAGRTVVQYKGVTVGRVTGVELAPGLRRVRVRLRLERAAAEFAREQTAFWVVQPQIGLSGIRGLETLFSGVRLAVQPGGGAPQTTFRGRDAPPPPNGQAGRLFVLESPRLGGLAAGSPVSYREVRVGAVEEARLAEDARQVLIRVRIEPPYDHLVRANTRFWRSGGISMKVGLLGAELTAGSLASVVSGGLSFATPEADAIADPAADGTRFELHDEPEDAWLEWRPAIPVEPAPPATSPEIGRDGPS